MLDHPAGLHLLPRCADIALTVGELTRRGVTFTHKPRMIAKMDDHDLWMAFFADPDGHTLAVMQEAPERLRTAAALTRLAGLHNGWHLRYPRCGRSGGQRSA